MDKKMMPDFGVNEIAQRIHGRLQRYLEAQYHIKDPSVIEERKHLLEEAGTISQRPYVEVTPTYAAGKDFSKLDVPKVIADLLQELSNFSPSVGVFSPYKHQSDALENFFSRENEKDLIVATGTGSGKTETFLYTILGSLALEGEQRPRSFNKSGVRALLLYPMNALVSDQTSRLRRLFGDENVAALFKRRWGKHPTFGMYTSRTPYPGLRSSEKDAKNLAPLLEYYVNLESSADGEKQKLVEELKKRGRFPAKNVKSFFNKEVETQRSEKSVWRNWEKRFHTSPEDRELLTRDEIQQKAPDLLVTNYSMLEYMMLRPIEASIFDQTKKWLQEDERNQLLLILDEAHMYRGVGGAEVGFLIRRLMSRLGINRDRLRCILTSASLGDSPEAQLKGIEFADALTSKTSKRKFAVIRGTREERSGSKGGTKFEADGLMSVNEATLASADVDPKSAVENIKQVASKLNWTEPPDFNENANNFTATRQYVTKCLNGFGPLEFLIEICSGNATAFSDLSKKIFPELLESEAERATNGLLALGTFARRTEPNREEQPLLPTRVHMLYRGVPAIYACINSDCEYRRDNSENNLLGRLYVEPRTHCRCGARVYEIYTHRDCGTAFLRVFGIEGRANFFWHESGGKISSLGAPLHEYHVLLEEPHPKQFQKLNPAYIDVKTGRVSSRLENLDDARLCYLPVDRLETRENLTTFKTCPVCLKRTHNKNGLKIMDLSTKGEQPFANIIREQFVCQAPTKDFNSRHPNGGRKSLLFSDGRQKAARLARDLPREVERDSFREAIILAIKRLNELGKEAVLDKTLYASFIAVCAEFNLHFFDKNDQEQLIGECNNFNKFYKDDFEGYLEDSSAAPTLSYRKALLRQISDPYYSLASACAAYVEPKASQFKRFKRELDDIAGTEIIEQVALYWIQKMLSKNAFDPAISYNARKYEFQYFDKIDSDSDLTNFFKNISEELAIDGDSIGKLRDHLFGFFTANADGDSDSGKLLKPELLKIKITLEESWWQCVLCGNLQLNNITGKCDNCGLKQLEQISPDHPYLTARKGFFREPLIAVLNGERPIHITAEEHTAQLAQRDSDKVYATTEEFELRFQDVPLNDKKPPVDVLSCTTTMEVGIDIGSLTAVGLRTVPPQRENYQQRAGRAGRRGTSISSVVTFAQGGAHDAHYFSNPSEMISGAPREPRIKIDNPRLAKRHINSYLLQTFFYEKLENLSEDEKEHTKRNRPNLMSAYGDVQDFFAEEGLFSFNSFKEWINEFLLGGKSPRMQEVVSWLPDDLFGINSSDGSKEKFINDVITEFLNKISEIKQKFSNACDDGADLENHEENEDRFLLNVLFNRGLLPSYAFPTDLCSFYILQKEGAMLKIKERPQMAKAQALSEYAPGRLLVINKETYRVGGMLFYPITTSNPAAAVFGKELRKYLGCQQCTYLRLENGKGQESSLKCPICAGDLYIREIIDPPDFAPEGARPLSENDRDQDITYATSAEMPEVADRSDFIWENCPGTNLQYTKKADVELIVLNKGKDFKGFDFCESCGAGWLSEDEDADATSHLRPFPIPGFLYKKEKPSPKCSGEIRRKVFLKHQFLTDVFLLRIPVKSPFDFSPDMPWLRDALTTFAEAFALGASLQLDIDPGELSAGFRMLPPKEEENGNLEIFLYDTTSGGAGYAYDAGENLIAVLERTRSLLSRCPNEECDTSCTKCLRHYGNRFLHPRLNRLIGLQLLDYAMKGKVPEIENANLQIEMLEPLARFLELEGWDVRLGIKDGETEIPLSATSELGRQIVVGTHPVLLEQATAVSRHELTRRVECDVYVLSDYLVQNDLPIAYQTISDPKQSSNAPRSRAKPKVQGHNDSLAFTSMLDFLSQKKTSSVQGDGSASNGNDDFFGVKIDSSDLSAVDVFSGDALVLKPFVKSNVMSQSKYLLRKRKGSFDSTGRAMTIASIKFVEFGEKRMVQVSYAKPEKRFRPERIDVEDVEIIGEVIEIISRDI